MLVYEGRKLVGNTWIIIVGMRKNKEDVRELIMQRKNDDPTYGGMIDNPLATKYRIVTYDRLDETEEV